jgi:hypothetical protein
MIARRADRPAAISLGEGEAYDAENRVSTSCVRWTRRRMLQNTCGRSAAIDERTIRQGGYAVSPRIRNADRAGIRRDQDSRAENRRPASAIVIASHGPFTFYLHGHRPRLGAAVQAELMRATAEAREGSGPIRKSTPPTKLDSLRTHDGRAKARTTRQATPSSTTEASSRAGRMLRWLRAG